MSRMNIESFYEPGTGSWTHLLADDETGRCAIIDPVWVFDPVSGETDSQHIESVLQRIAGEDLTLEWVLETHAHADHLSAAGVVTARHDVPVAIGEGIRAVQENFVRVFHLEDVPTDGRQFDRLFEDGDTFSIGSLTAEVLATPGHTADSVTYRVGDAAFIGDTLFAPGYGSARCDFPGGDAGQLYDSVQRLHALPDSTRLYLCHDYPQGDAEPRASVTVAESKAENIHLRDGTDKSTFVEMRTARDAKLALPRLILPSLQVNIRAGRAPDPEGNGVSYLKLPFSTDIEKLLKPT